MIKDGQANPASVQPGRLERQMWALIDIAENLDNLTLPLDLNAILVKHRLTLANWQPASLKQYIDSFFERKLTELRQANRKAIEKQAAAGYDEKTHNGEGLSEEQVELAREIWEQIPAVPDMDVVLDATFAVRQIIATKEQSTMMGDAWARQWGRKFEAIEKGQYLLKMAQSPCFTQAGLTYLRYCAYLFDNPLIPQSVYAVPKLVDIQNWITRIGVRHADYGVMLPGGEQLFVCQVGSKTQFSCGTIFRLTDIFQSAQPNHPLPKVPRAALLAWKMVTDALRLQNVHVCPSQCPNLLPILGEIWQLAAGFKIPGDPGRAEYDPLPLKRQIRQLSDCLAGLIPSLTTRHRTQITEAALRVAKLYDASAMQIGKHPRSGLVRGLVLGDSVAAGVRANSEFVTNVTNTLRQDYALELVNASVPGTNTNHGRMMLAKQLSAYQPHFVCIPLGGNDAFEGLDRRATTLANLKAMLKQCVQFDPKMEIFMGYGVPNTFTGKIAQDHRHHIKQTLDALNEYARELAQEVKYPVHFHPVHFQPQVFAIENCSERRYPHEKEAAYQQRVPSRLRREDAIHPRSVRPLYNTVLASLVPMVHKLSAMALASYAHGFAETKRHGLCKLGHPPEWVHKRIKLARQDYIRCPNKTTLQHAIDLGISHHGNFIALAWLIEQGIALEVPNTFGQTALHYACARGAFAAALLLLQAGANPFASDHTGQLPQHYLKGNQSAKAIQLYRVLRCVKAIQSSYPSVKNLRDQGKTLLMWAAEHGLNGLAEGLCLLGAEVDECNPYEYNMTAVHYAAVNGKHRLVECLKRFNADMHRRDGLNRSAQQLASHMTHGRPHSRLRPNLRVY